MALIEWNIRRIIRKGDSYIYCLNIFFERSVLIMLTEQNKSQRPFRKQYSGAIDTIPLPENLEEHIQLVMKKVAPVVDQIIADDM